MMRVASSIIATATISPRGGLELPANHPCWAEEPGRIWREIDAACEDGAVDAVRAWHIVLTLPDDRPEPEWVPLVRGFVRETLVRRGPAVAWAVHAQRGVRAAG